MSGSVDVLAIALLIALMVIDRAGAIAERPGGCSQDGPGDHRGLY
jgi:hypothetical protein